MKNFLLIIMALLSFSARGQQKLVLESPYLTQRNTILVFKPGGYDEKNMYPLVYLLHGYSEGHEQWSRLTNLQQYADRYNCIIVCPEGFFSYYVDSPFLKGSQFESFFFKSLVPEIHRQFRVDTDNIFISGLSMGGYGALHLFFGHSDYFNTAASTSGALSPDYVNYREVSQLFWKSDRMTDDLRSIFGDPGKKNWQDYSILNQLKQYANLKRPFFIDCGRQDVLYSNSVDLFNLAKKLDVPVTFISQPGGHDGGYWSKSVAHHFVYFMEHFK